MGDIPLEYSDVKSVINIFSPECPLCDWVLVPNAGVGNAAWPTANKVIYVPFFISKPVTLVKATWCNGATVSGNLDIGLYDEFGHRLINSGSTAQSGVNVLQTWDMTDTLFNPGRYYSAMTFDNATGIVRRANPLAIWLNANGVQEEVTGSFGLPATATFANPSSAYAPDITWQLLTTL